MTSLAKHRAPPRRRLRIVAASSAAPEVAGTPPESWLHPERRSRKVGPLPVRARLALAAMERLRAALGAADREFDAPRAGVSLGTLFGSIEVAEQCLGAVHEHGFERVTPSWYATGLPNATAAILASLAGLQGPNLSFLGYQAGLDAIAAAGRQILAGHADAMCAGGFDLPSERYVERARAAAPFERARGIHAGVGLVWLAAGEPRAGDAGELLGWSQCLLDEAAFEAARAAGFRSLIAAARAMAGANANANADARVAELHLVRPGAPDAIDRLAAGAPVALAEGLADGWCPGLHALVVRGLGAVTSCVLVDNETMRNAADE
ncbi:MAG: beta-ketoacyl synthase N-terminal-like domain-containing protein [Burkholderia sp.]